ncbi:MAG: hypothetical protein IPM45_12805 [Acidimicrobiales bacterium]|nr:hypothetical protein [Acidimicrobiales bacterium]
MTGNGERGAATPRAQQVADEAARRRRRREFAERFARGDSYGLLLVAVLATYVLLAVLPATAWSRVLITAGFCTVLLLALHTSRWRGRGTRVLQVIALAAVANSVVQAIIGYPHADTITYLTVLLMMVAPVAVLRSISRHQQVGLETVLGGISVYVLLGVSFAAIYLAVDSISGGFFAQASENRVSFLYFSFITMTTVGYGDLTPGTEVGQVLASLEALVGQIYLVTVVAWLVSGFARTRRDNQAAASDPGLDVEADPQP